ncbi:MAG: ABC transporter permease subunit [Hyphomicrobiales bacterium]|nr:ABC transporter permease subunit [Hyphomicrobiales bacterium]
MGIALAFAAPAAIAIARYRFAGRDALRALFMSLLMIPPILLGIAFLRFFSLTGLSGTMTGLVIAHVVVVFPFALCMVLARVAGMDKRIEDAAVSLGASRPIVYRRIILPLMVPGLASSFALSFIQSFDEVTMTVFVASPATTTLPVRMFNDIQDSIDSVVCAISASLILGMILLMLVLDRLHGLERLFVGDVRN